MSERRVHPSFGVEGPCSGACFPARGHTCCVRGSDVNFNRVQSLCMYQHRDDDDVTAPASQGLGVGVGRAGRCPRRSSWAGPAGGSRTGWTGRWPRPAGWPMLTVCAHDSDFLLLLPAAPPHPRRPPLLARSRHPRAGRGRQRTEDEHRNNHQPASPGWARSSGSLSAGVHGRLGHPQTDRQSSGWPGCACHALPASLVQARGARARTPCRDE